MNYTYKQVFSQAEVDEFVSHRLRFPFEKAVIRSRENRDIEDLSKRKSERQYIPFDYTDPFIAKLTCYIMHICNNVYNRYDLWTSRQWELLRYTQGDFFGRHHDQINPVMGPFVSAVVYLGGEYTGGEVRIYNGNTQDTVAIKQQAGFVLTYPSDTYHEVSKVTGGTRLSLVNFFGVKPPAPRL